VTQKKDSKVNKLRQESASRHPNAQRKKEAPSSRIRGRKSKVTLKSADGNVSLALARRRKRNQLVYLVGKSLVEEKIIFPGEIGSARVQRKNQQPKKRHVSTGGKQTRFLGEGESKEIGH